MTRETPLPKTGEVKRDRTSEYRLVDRESKDSFPASDPPSHNAGTIGAPKKRETPAPDTKDFDEVKKKK